MCLVPPPAEGCGAEGSHGRNGGEEARDVRGGPEGEPPDRHPEPRPEGLPWGTAKVQKSKKRARDNKKITLINQTRKWNIKIWKHNIKKRWENAYNIEQNEFCVVLNQKILSNYTLQNYKLQWIL